jgi:hypothetical protein
LDLSQMLINIDDDHFLLAADSDVPFEATALLLHAQIQQKVTPYPGYPKKPYPLAFWHTNSRSDTYYRQTASNSRQS